jgi:hypothetical protein
LKENLDQLIVFEDRHLGFVAVCRNNQLFSHESLRSSRKERGSSEKKGLAQIKSRWAPAAESMASNATWKPRRAARRNKPCLRRPGNLRTVYRIELALNLDLFGEPACACSN